MKVSQDCAGCWFGFKAHQGAHSRDYVTLDATQKPGQQTSKMGYFILSEALIVRPALPDTQDRQPPS